MWGREKMIDHASISVCDLELSDVFYQNVLAPLGLLRLVDRETAIGFGKSYPEFWLNLRVDMLSVEGNSGNHICLRAPTNEAVIAFYNIAISHGGRCDGAPGERQAAVTTYFGAFIRDLDGNKIEAVCFPRMDAS